MGLKSMEKIPLADRPFPIAFGTASLEAVAAAVTLFRPCHAWCN
jgi:hypothetical protein